MGPLRRASVFVLLVVLAILPAVPASALVEVPVPSPGFEVDRNGDGVADGWEAEVQGPEKGGKGEFSLDPKVKVEGRFSQRIRNFDRTWVRASIYPPGIPGALYLLNVWVRSTCRTGVVVYEFTSPDRSKYITHNVFWGTCPEWRKVSFAFRASEDLAAGLKISLITDSPGEAWFDGLKLWLVRRPWVCVHRAPSPPHMDGRLDDPCWRRATEASPFLLLGAEGKEPKAGTRAWLTYDDRALYVAFKCEEPEVDKIRAKVAERDGPVYDDDCVEVFLDPERTRACYFHLAANALGTKFDEKVQPPPLWNKVWFKVPERWGPGREWDGNWRAAARVGKGFWTAEFEVPFSALGLSSPRPGEEWGLALCRERKAVSENSCYPYIPGSTFHSPGHFAVLKFVGHGRAAGKVVEAPPRPSPPTVIPRPQRMRLLGGTLALPPVVLVSVVGGGGSDVVRSAASDLAEGLSARFGLKVDYAVGKVRGAHIVLACGPVAPSMARERGLSLPKKSEGYCLDSTRLPVLVCGHDPRGVYCGAMSLLQLLALDEGRPSVWRARIEDWPDIRFRGWHLSGPHEGFLQRHRAFLRALARLKFNAVIYQAESCIRTESHPEVAGRLACSKEEARALVDFCKRRGIEVIPHIQCWSHCYWLLRAHPELDEGRGTEKRQLYDWCPRNPEVYKILDDMVREFLEVFRPRRFFSLGMDEIQFAGQREPVGLCPRCRGTDLTELLAEGIERACDVVRKYGLRPMMWGDMLCPGYPYRPEWGPPALDKLRRDIVILHWFYGPERNFSADLRYFMSKGFAVVGAGWYRPLNIKRFTEAVKETDAFGYIGTTWLGTEITRDPWLNAAVVLAAENTWSVDNPDPLTIRYDPVAEYRKFASLPRREASGEFLCLDLSWLATDQPDSLEPMDLDRGKLKFPRGLLWARGVPFLFTGRCAVLSAGTEEDKPPSVELPLGVKAKRLYFVHATSKPGREYASIYETRRRYQGVVGRYVVRYEDGTVEEVPLTYRLQIADWNTRLSPADGFVVWRGRTAKGALVALCALPWDNPWPGRGIESVRLDSSGGLRLALLALTVER